jgi:sulfate transporter 4
VLWQQINKLDWIVFNVAFICVMFLGVDKGLAAAIGLSVIIVLWRVAFPKTAVLGRLPGTTVYR